MHFGGKIVGWVTTFGTRLSLFFLGGSRKTPLSIYRVLVGSSPTILGHCISVSLDKLAKVAGSRMLLRIQFPDFFFIFAMGLAILLLSWSSSAFSYRQTRSWRCFFFLPHNIPKKNKRKKKIETFMAQSRYYPPPSKYSIKSWCGILLRIRQKVWRMHLSGLTKCHAWEIWDACIITCIRSPLCNEMLQRKQILKSSIDLASFGETRVPSLFSFFSFFFFGGERRPCRVSS